jgi:MtN3 and saliva related transmembrane protein
MRQVIYPESEPLSALHMETVRPGHPERLATMMTDLIGYTAASFTTISFLPQVIKALRERDTHSLSLGMYVIFTVGAGLWTFYGYLRHETVIIIANSITTGLCLVILIVKMRNDSLERQVNAPGRRV